MKTLGVSFVLAGLAALVLVGCSDEVAKPVVSRLSVSETCGVAPLAVEFRADATGGQRSSDPTGGNNFLTLRWDFGDGTPSQTGTSIMYHSFAVPDTYRVTVTAEDDDGEVSAPLSREIIVNADTLAVTAYTMVGEELSNVVHSCEPITFGVRAAGCDFDPDTGYYERFTYTWTVDQPGTPAVYEGPHPRHSFAPAATGEYTVHLRLVDPALSLTRTLEFPVTVIQGSGTTLSLTTDWLGDDQDVPVIVVSAAGLPDTLTYALKLNCAGPDPGYGVRVRGRIPVANRVKVLDTIVEAPDELTYTTRDSAGWEIRSFVWRAPSIAADETRVARVRFVLEAANAYESLSFYGRIFPYACDADTFDNRVETLLLVDP